MNKGMRIELVKGRAHWRWRMRDGNNEILCVSETFAGKGSALRAVDNVLGEFGCKRKSVDVHTVDKLYYVTWGRC